MNTRIVILAAGLGTRMRSKRAKVLHRAGGMALVEHVTAAARVIADADSIVVVTGHQADEVEKLLAPQGLKFARQSEPKGTGHALECARAAAASNDGLLMVLYGDTPLLTAATLTRLRDVQANSDAGSTLITTTLVDPTGYGRVVTNTNGDVLQIVEHKDCTSDQREIRVINSGIYCFRADLLWKHLGEVTPNPISDELYLTDMAAILASHGHRMQSMHIDDPNELLGINNRVELAEADHVLRTRKTTELMISGVTIERPETVSIDSQVRIGADTIVEPFTRILGATTIGEDCHIAAGSIIESSTLGDRVLVKPYTMVADCTIASTAQLGPFARLRMNAEVAEGVRVGNFVEVKKSKLAAKVAAQHLAYLGDAEIGAKTNIGAGTITCNYDGEKKHVTKIGEDVFIGSNATLVAPIEIGDRGYVGAGSTITDAVPPESLAIGRGRQVNKEGWVAKRRNRERK